MGRARFEAEFGHYAAWIVDAIVDIGFHDPVPAACRGTGNPSLLSHLADGLRIQNGSLVLDVGIGLGGPAAWLARECSCRVVGIDIMVEAARGARRLFPDVSVAVASTRALPLRDRTVDAAWALGVIEMIADKQRAFREIERVLRPGARVVLYDFVATESVMEDMPAASRFESAESIVGKIEHSGLKVIKAHAIPSIAPPPSEWRTAIARVRERIRSDHDGDRRLALAEGERENFNRLRRCGSILEWEFVAERPV
jgi:SAM-dependent methyltransferase